MIALFRLPVVLCCSLLTPLWLAAQSTTTDIEYARVGDKMLTLDLHLPGEPKAPLVVYVHGGAWRAGSKSDVPIAPLLAHGFAIASVDYRLSTESPFPAQVHDIKAAIRFLRGKAELFHLNAACIAIIGSSAGGHLAALVGVTNGVKELEGAVGDHLTQSSDVQCIVSYYGASNLQTILAQSTDFGRRMRVPALKLLLGGTPDEKPELARLASPVAHIDQADPPLLLIHGTADPQMPPEQSDELAKAYRAQHREITLVPMINSKHGGSEFYDDDRTKTVATFLKRHLLQ